MENRYLLTYRIAIDYKGICSQIINTYKWFNDEEELRNFTFEKQKDELARFKIIEIIEIKDSKNLYAAD